ncbi:cell surface protein [Flavobacterium sp. MMLR14_040]|uniref:cell surface protein n=1 Tax=Flavobacterium sp. MMLR14_040 TaxID=3093843 RepID=UPI00298F79D3|nr:cell surface protein [Flavobacterium sp. MMLR14_040]MDW8848532.1 cell surface protein [Flavobacterium sp. MMLR14_040]
MKENSNSNFYENGKIHFKILKIALLLILLLEFIACGTDKEEDLGDENPTEILKESYTINRFKVLNIITDLPENSQFIWSINDSVISQSSQLDFISPYLKNYPLTLKVETNGVIKTYQSIINVTKETGNYSKYISNVFDFRPAIGQFTNEIPEYVSGNTETNLISTAKKSLVGSNSTMVSLGGFGGYVVFGFDHTIPNRNGRDFKILGNAFWGNEASEARSGSCEPGIILVAYDKNKNGKPDEDEWYEIAGSEYFKNTTIKNYSITYFKPEVNKAPVAGDEFWQADVEYIKWQDNLGNSGHKTQNSFHNQSYYPLWISDASYSLKGTKIENNFYNQSGAENEWLGKSLDFGYADNAPNNDEASNIDISWAVDKNGNYVKLPGIDFIKVYTAVNQEAGWLGEVSTEVAGAYDLYLN